MTGLKYHYFTPTNILTNVGTNHWWLLALEKNRDTTSNVLPGEDCKFSYEIVLTKVCHLNLTFCRYYYKEMQNTEEHVSVHCM